MWGMMAGSTVSQFAISRRWAAAWRGGARGRRRCEAGVRRKNGGGGGGGWPGRPAGPIGSPSGSGGKDPLAYWAKKMIFNFDMN
jgi:hypothetical protein